MPFNYPAYLGGFPATVTGYGTYKQILAGNSNNDPTSTYLRQGSLVLMAQHDCVTADGLTSLPKEQYICGKGSQDACQVRAHKLCHKKYQSNKIDYNLNY